MRRVTYDLTGLPPAPEELDAFLADTSPEAYPRVVDRLLASPAYGERWARHWLDVVRYADARDLIQLPAESDFREAWRYRDWVVGAHNADVPFARFVQCQVAGDLLQSGQPESLDVDALVGTGLLAIADFVPGDVDKDRMIADYVNDQIDVVSRAFLGVTLACARCHDHKSDPFSMEDYYGLAGIFFSTRLVPGPVKGNTPLLRAPLLPRAELDRIEANRQRVASLEQSLQQLSRDRDAEYFDAIERLTAEQSGKYLCGLAEFRRPAGTAATTNLAEFARARGLEPAYLDRWATRIAAGNAEAWMSTNSSLVPGWSRLVAAAMGGKADSLETLDLLAQQFRSSLLESLGRTSLRDPAFSNSVSSSATVRLHAGDPRRVSGPDGRVSLLPSRVRGLRHLATIPQGSSGPISLDSMVAGHLRPVLRFSGKDLLELPIATPSAGSLFIVFRRADPQAEGQRVVGWEDSDSGRHGLGLMLKAGGGLHAIARADGVSGDVVSGPMTNETFELVCLTWGPRGVNLRREGRTEGTNAAITRLSADPAIRSLRIGGPGSGGSARFAGDFAELRLYDRPLDENECTAVETELRTTWCDPSTPPLPASPDPIARLLDTLSAPTGPFWLPDEQRDRLLSPGLSTRLQQTRQALAEVHAKIPAEIPQAVVVQDGGPADTRHAGFQDATLFIRGDPKRPGKVVPRALPAVLAGATPPFSNNLTNASGRRQLADWLTSSENPLTARVAVNRVWQHHFGEGLVRTPTNFGERGERPTHPDLLDYLANRFVESGGSMKALHRLILLSATYQQESTPSREALERDPENRLLSHMNRRRLDAEEIRDSLLAAAGQLDLSTGGKPVQEVSSPRRSLYLMAVRTGAKTGFAALFDAADCGAIVDRRSVSTVAPQSLFLLNDTFTAEMTRRLASRIRRDIPHATPEIVVQRAYRQLLGRPPSPEEARIGRELLGSMTGEEEALERYCQVLFCTNEFIYLD